MKIRVHYLTHWVCDLESLPDGTIKKSGPRPHGCDEQLAVYGRAASGDRLLATFVLRMRGGYWTAGEVDPDAPPRRMAEGEPRARPPEEPAADRPRSQPPAQQEPPPVPPAWTYEHSAEGVDPEDHHADVAGYRVQARDDAMPEESSSQWTGDDWTGRTMGGVSSYAAATNAFEDLVFGEDESLTGENYAKNVRGRGGEPQLWLLTSDHETIDGPGAETIVPNARHVGRFSAGQMLDALRAAIAEDFPGDDLGGMSPEEIKEDYDWTSWAPRAVEILRERARNARRPA